jgi:hypothetical protein
MANVPGKVLAAGDDLVVWVQKGTEQPFINSMKTYVSTEDKLLVAPHGLG